MDTSLPAHILAVLSAAGHKAYFVGGYVRDHLLGRDAKDIDITTSATPEDVVELFPSAERIGAHFGVVLVKGEEGGGVEVATFRLDGAYADGRHPSSVAYTTDVKEDLRRRDFTVNALVMDVNGVTFDFVGGFYDIEHRRIRAVGDATARFAEDALRMLRAVRFACQLDFTIEEGTLEGIRRNADRIRQISAERIQQELTRILTSGRAAEGIRLLERTGLLVHILPEVCDLIGVRQNPVHHPEGDVYTHTLSLLRKLDKGCSVTLALAALLHDIGKPATYGEKDGQPTFYGHEEAGAQMVGPILSRLKYPTEVIEIVREHVAQHMRFRVVQEMRRSKLYRFLRQPHFAELLALHRLDASSGSGNLANAEFVEQVLGAVPVEKIAPPRLVTGDDLIAFGLKPGPHFRELLDAVETEQLEGGVEDREQALLLVQALAAK